MGAKIRPLRTDDFEAASRIVTLIYGDTEITNFLRQDLNDSLSNAHVKPFFFVLEKNEEIIGFIGYVENTMTFNAYQIFWTMVHPSYQRQGIGTLLMNHVIHEIKKKKGTYIVLLASYPDFYKKFGFIEIDTLHGDQLMSSHL